MRKAMKAMKAMKGKSSKSKSKSGKTESESAMEQAVKDDDHDDDYDGSDSFLQEARDVAPGNKRPGKMNKKELVEYSLALEKLAKKQYDLRLMVFIRALGVKHRFEERERLWSNMVAYLEDPVGYAHYPEKPVAYDRADFMLAC